MSVMILNDSTLDQVMWVCLLFEHRRPPEWAPTDRNPFWHHRQSTSLVDTREDPYGNAFIRLMADADLRFILRFLNEMAYANRYREEEKPSYFEMPSWALWTTDPEKVTGHEATRDWWNKGYAYKMQQKTPSMTANGFDMRAIIRQKGLWDEDHSGLQVYTYRKSVIPAVKAARCWLYNIVEAFDRDTWLGRLKRRQEQPLEFMPLESVHPARRPAYLGWHKHASENKAGLWRLAFDPTLVVRHVEKQVEYICHKFVEGSEEYSKAPWNGDSWDPLCLQEEPQTT